jgi:hypothetical protein
MRCEVLVSTVRAGWAQRPWALESSGSESTTSEDQHTDGDHDERGDEPPHPDGCDEAAARCRQLLGRARGPLIDSVEAPSTPVGTVLPAIDPPERSRPSAPTGHVGRPNEQDPLTDELPGVLFGLISCQRVAAEAIEVLR